MLDQIRPYHPIAIATDQRRHQREKDHDEAVIGDEHVEHFRIAEDLQAWLHKPARMAIDNNPPITPASADS
jgi:hypothetical protein